jgi:SAM-dependent methyltransferase
MNDATDFNENLHGWYDDDYLFFSSKTTNEERTANELEFIWQALQLRPGESVLDLGCGHGRIANRLAQRGANVTGIDVVPLFLDRARSDAAKLSVAVDYRQGTICELSELGPFDAVIVWFFSFGYGTDEDNFATLQAISRVLRPGGRLLFDQYNIAALARAGDRYTVLELGDDLLLQRPICDLEAGRWGAERIVVRNGQTRRARFMCRCYSPTELKAVLLATGFDAPVFMGDGFEKLGLDSMKQIVVTSKAR